MAGKYIGQYYTGSAYGAFMFDPRGGKNAFTTISSLATGHAQGGFTDPDDNELYLIDYDSGGGNAQVELFKVVLQILRKHLKPHSLFYPDQLV